MMKGHLFFWVLVLEGLVGLHRTSACLARVVVAQTWINVMLSGLPWKRTEIIVIYEIAPKY